MLYKCFDQILRPLMLARAEKAGMPKRILKAFVRVGGLVALVQKFQIRVFKNADFLDPASWAFFFSQTPETPKKRVLKNPVFPPH